VRVIIEVDGCPVDFSVEASVSGSAVDVVLAALLGEAKRQVEAGHIDLDPPDGYWCGVPVKRTKPRGMSP
jgi:hypothetical protein